ncbi:hypothetical protein ACQJBY_026879 [Aegilops geniculata]
MRAWPTLQSVSVPQPPHLPARCHVRQTYRLQSKAVSCRRAHLLPDQRNEATARATWCGIGRSTPRRTTQTQQKPTAQGRDEKGGAGTGEGKRVNQGSGGATREQEEKAAHPRPQPVVDIVDSSSPCKMFYIYVQQKRVSCARKCRRCESFFFWNEKNQRIQQQIQPEICFVCLQIFPL